MGYGAGDVDAAGGSVRKRMGDARAIANDEQAAVLGLELRADLDFHIIELDFHAVEQRVVVRGAGRDLFERVEHFYYAVEYALGHYE